MGASICASPLSGSRKQNSLSTEAKSDMRGPPRILEIGEHPLMMEAFPATTSHWSTRLELDAKANGDAELVTLGSLPRLVRALSSDAYDLVVLQPTSFRFWQWQAITRSLFRRSILRGRTSYFRSLGQELIRAHVRAPIAIWDMADAPIIPSQHAFFLDRSTLYFKRELPADHWRVFMGTLHHQVPTLRFRNAAKHRRRIEKLRPISLGLPLGLDRSPMSDLHNTEKESDVFFAGRVQGSATVRETGLKELLALRERGLRVDIPDSPLPLPEFLKRSAQAWLTWAPEGYGYETFRAYEAPFCGSVPVLNLPPIHRYKPLQDGVHCFYHAPEPGSLTRTVEMALADRARLIGMARSARQFVLAEHTFSSLGRYVAETTLAQAR
jgi:hypothetical protein